MSNKYGGKIWRLIKFDGTNCCIAVILSIVYDYVDEAIASIGVSSIIIRTYAKTLYIAYTK
ncbi:MAG: hypothetical protein F6K24_00085 [Okeania sp. SIO2D1]|nr:hypothetical protein [Okeania sp. SIO2D1]